MSLRNKGNIFIAFHYDLMNYDKILTGNESSLSLDFEKYFENRSAKFWKIIKAQYSHGYLLRIFISEKKTTCSKGAKFYKLLTFLRLWKVKLFMWCTYCW